MTFAFRFLIILITILFSNRILPGIKIENFFFDFCVAAIYAIIIAAIRPFAKIYHRHHSWKFLGVVGFIVVGILYLIFIAGVWGFIGMYANLSSGIIGFIIVWVISTLCNHYVAVKKTPRK